MVASDPLRRPARLDALTGLRFWFAFLVLMHHSLMHWFGHTVYPLADFGYIGVDFFFVLSGFVLTWSARPGVSARRFWWHRFARIWPLHLTTLALAAAVGVGVTIGTGLPLVANLFLVQAWFPQQPVFFGFNAVSWSLSCEVFFYLCFPLLLRGLSRLGRRGLLAVASGVFLLLAGYPGVFSLTVAPRDPDGWEWSTYVLPAWRLGEFVLGIVAALALARGWRPRVSARAALLAAVALAAAYVGFGQWRGNLPNRPLTEVVAMPVIALVLVAVVAAEMSGRRSWLASWPMVDLGAASYALYLCHALLYGWLTARWPATGQGAMRVVGWGGYVLAALGLALLLHHLVEVPAERRLRRLADRQRTAAVPAYPLEPLEPVPELALHR